MAQLSTQSTGLTAESAAELKRLQDVQRAAYQALSGVSPASPEYNSLNAAAYQSSIQLNKFEPVNAPTTYYVGENEVPEAEYQATRLEQAVAGSGATEEHIVGDVTVGRITADDPVAVRQFTAEELEGEDIIAANIRRSTPGTPEFIAAQEDAARLQEEAEGQAIIDANIKRAEDAEAAAILAERQAESQQLASELNDWRVRLHLAPDANYLYKAEYPGILAPLVETNGIIFPYTPTIAIQYAADYENYDLVHSNYRGYFYKGSQVQNILFTATFTANSVQEADYMLAAMHFLKSATKMFYGQDTQRGMPPPVVFLTGLGEYQFNNHPCVLTMVNYNLPNDVDYIPCGKPAGVDTNFTVPAKSNDKEALKEARLRASGIGPGGKSLRSQLDQGPVQGDISTYTKATYMPTKLEITFTMVPIQTRDQVSSEFSLEEYATGFLLKKGFW